ncbi:aminotransferase class V-fold PLP-dependent enzyme [Chitinivorax sp. B]|uniref:aminotransferase class V-fold PLP-dependent enzyme n=1 Tax=Chitinivorax sp. B TaxID=2502235 RepID=UPI0010FA3C63|nr:aminotransferase class V-fold PLP-dependent enzyme [Chitinivorax sp. B]
MIADYLTHAINAMGDGPLTEASIHQHLAPLFSQVLSRDEIYLANHSLGRPLDQTMHDVAEAISLWQHRLDSAWEPWLDEQTAFRQRVAMLIGAPRPDCIVPKTSAGQGLRAVLNSLSGSVKVVSTRGEFDSIDFILKQYREQGHIRLNMVEPDQDGLFQADDIKAEIDTDTKLVVISQVMFMTGQVISELTSIINHAHANGAQVLIDAYHAVGVIPVDVTELDCDYLIGGSYKYLRGGPGACWLYLAPKVLAQHSTTLDTGWFAKHQPFSYARPDTPAFGPGGDSWLESTPPVLTWYQSRAGQQLALGIGVDRLRTYSLQQQRELKARLRILGVYCEGGDENHGAYLTIRHPQAIDLSLKLMKKGINTDARLDRLRLCPDLLNTSEELSRASDIIATVLKEGT